MHMKEGALTEGWCSRSRHGFSRKSHGHQTISKSTCFVCPRSGNRTFKLAATKSTKRDGIVCVHFRAQNEIFFMPVFPNLGQPGVTAT